MNLDGEAKWLSGTFDWDLTQATEFVRSIQAATLRNAADQISTFRDWYPLSIFPSIEEALAEDAPPPSSERIAASSYRHAYGDVVPRNLREWARELETGDEA